MRHRFALVVLLGVPACDEAGEEARLTALETQVQGLQAQVADLQARVDAATPAAEAPLGEPPDTAWVILDGVAWATNGHVLIRRDGPRPDLTEVRPRWLPAMAPEEFATLVVVPSPNAPLVRLDTVDDKGTTVVRYRQDPDGPVVYVDAGYAEALVGKVVQGADPLGPVYAVADDGTARAVVMPRQPPGL